MKTQLFTLVALLLAGAMCMAQEEGEVQVLNRTLEIDGRTYAWSVMIPDSAQSGGAAILFLHGAGECGTDGERNLSVGLPRFVRENPEKWPFVIIVPQKPNMDSEWEDHEDAVLEMLTLAHDEGLYDPERLAITGLSQGGHGTIMLASKYPEKFRCAAPVCGYVDRRFDDNGVIQKEIPATPEDESILKAARTLKDMPVWLFHGAQDDVVPIEESSVLANALRAQDADVRYTEYPEAAHNSWDAAYSEEELSDWFLEHTGE